MSDRCPFGCTLCGRKCSAAQPYNHRFDCCGLIRAHVAEGLQKRGQKTERRWVDVANPMRAGYLTGPSLTTPPNSGPDAPSPVSGPAAASTVAQKAAQASTGSSIHNTN